MVSLSLWSQNGLSPDLWQTIGYNLTDAHLKILSSFLWLPNSQKLGSQQLLTKIEKFIAQENPKVPNRSQLAQKIFRSAWALGIDPIIWTALIRQESVFDIKARSPTGALGLTQMTQIAMAEVRNQLGVGDPRFQARGADILRQMLMNYFESNTKVADFINWVKATTTRSTYVQGITTNVDYSLLTGAILLKVYLALNQGQYATALEDYNGSKIKKHYRQEVLKHAHNVQQMHQTRSPWVQQVLVMAQKIWGPGSPVFVIPSFQESYIQL